MQHLILLGHHHGKGGPGSYDKEFSGIAVAIITLLFLLILLAFIYWLLMLIHAIRHNSPDRVIWVVVLVASLIVGLAPIGAIVYRFAEKNRADRAGLANPVVEPNTAKTKTRQRKKK